MRATETARVPEDFTGRARRVPVGEVSWRTTFRALRHRNYRLFFYGQLVSLIGTWLQQTAMSWFVYEITRSKFLLGAVAAIGSAPMMVFSLWAVAASFAVGVAAVLDLVSFAPDQRLAVQHLYDWIVGPAASRSGSTSDSTRERDDHPRHHRRRRADPPVRDRLHRRRSASRSLLLLPQPLRVLHADAGPGGQLPPAVPRVGGRRAVLLPADRLLVRRVENAEAAKKAFITTRIGDTLMLVGLAAHRRPGSARSTSRSSSARPPPVLTKDAATVDRAAAVRRRDRQVGADPAARVAARRDGGPDARSRR